MLGPTTGHQPQTSFKKKSKIPYGSPILKLVSSTFEDLKDVVLVGTESSIIAEHIKVKAGAGEGEGGGAFGTVIERNTLCTWPVGSRLTSMALNPKSRPSLLQFAASYEDHSFVFYHSTKMVELLVVNKTWINDCSFDSTGNLLACVSDDGKCRLWNLSGKMNVDDDGMEAEHDADDVDSFCEVAPIVIPLSSRGVSIQFHKRQPSQMLVGEACGRVSLIDAQDGSVLMSVLVQAGLSQLKLASWHPENPLVFGVLTESNWGIYSSSKIQSGMEGQARYLLEHAGEGDMFGGCCFAWNLASPNPKMFAVPGKNSGGSSSSSISSKPCVHVFPNGFTKVPYTSTLPVNTRITSMAWNQSRSLLYVSAANKIHLIEI